jgi:putative nucleotidyltransferase with HDIG domain
MTDLKKIIKEIEKLEPIPQVAHKVMRIVQDTKSSMSQLSDVILHDPSLTANLLKVCNSAYFGLPNKIDSVRQAVVYLGTGQVVELVLMIGGAANLKKGQSGYDLKEGELWRYSVTSALIARELAERRGVTDNHLLFTGALIKDIGKVVLNQHVADSSERINALVLEHGLSFREAEKEVIGIDHAELGGLVAERWNFSADLVDIITNHHLPKESSSRYFETCLVFLADTICMMMGIGVGSDGLAYRFHRGVVELLNFSERDIQEIMLGFGEKFERVERLISLS